MFGDIREMCKKALKNELYTDKDSVFYMLLTTEKNCIDEMVLIGDHTLGMVWEYPEEFNISGKHIGVYVKPEFRRMGYATTAIDTLGGIGDRQWLIGEEGSGEFWCSITE